MRRSLRTSARLATAAGLLLAAGGPLTGDSPVRDLGETYHAPRSGEPWRAVRDDRTGRKWFVSPTGETAESAAEIAEREDTALTPLERTVESELLRDAADTSRAQETADVTFVLRRQPAHEAGMQARAAYGPLLAAPLARAREVVSRLATRRADPAHADPAEDLRLLTPEERATIAGSREETLSLLARMRREVCDRATSECAADQAPLVAWLGGQPGARVIATSWVLSTVTARVPLGLVVRAAESFPEVRRVERVRTVQADLNVSVPTVSASSWWNAGYSGSSATKVAVLDTGMDTSHPALTTVSNSSVHLSSGSQSFSFNDNANSTDDLVGHGTHVGGIVASNDTTDTGVAPGASLMNAKCGYRTSSGGGSLAYPDIYAAGDWAVTNGASAMNGSFGGQTSPANGTDSGSLYFDAIVYDLAIPVALSAGNSGSGSGTVGAPGLAFNVVTTGNFDDNGTSSLSDDAIVSSSSRGPTSDGRRKPDLAAPGENITSCSATWEGNGPDFVSLSGTSMASPHVAGSFALLLDAAATWAPEGLKALLLTTARNTSPAPTSPDDNWGWGGLALGAAYTARASVAEGSLTASGPSYQLYRLGSLASNGRVTLAWNRHVMSNGSSAPSSASSLVDLDLYLFDESSGLSAGQSTSSVNPVEQLKASSAVSSPILKVKRAGNFPSGVTTESFAIASETTTSATALVPPKLDCAFSQTPPSPVGAGATFTVVVTVTNRGDLVATVPTVHLAVPTGYSVAQTGGDVQTLDIAQGANRTAAFDVTAPSSGSGTKTFTASATCTAWGESFSGTAASATQSLDAEAPTGSVLIDAGALYATSRTVALAMTAADTGGTGLDAVRLRDAAGAWGLWGPFAASASFGLEDADGLRTVQMQVRDGVGNTTTVSDTISLDRAAPSGAVIFGDGSAATTATSLTVSYAATDAVSGVAAQRVSDDGTTFGNWEPYGTTHTATLGTGEGTTMRSAQFRDNAGNVSSTVSGRVWRDFTVPTGSIVIDGGAPMTNDRNVTLDFTASDNVSGVAFLRITTDGVSWTPWLAYTARIGSYLAFPDALNTISVQFRDGAGNVSATYSDSIVADATGPSGSIAIDGGAAYTGSSLVTLTLSASDALSGVDGMRLRDEGGAWGAWLTYATSGSWTLPSGEGARTVHVQYRDGSGNLSDDVAATIAVDKSGPSAAVVIHGGMRAVNHTDVSLDLSSQDSGSGLAGVRVRNQGGSWSDWTAVTPSLPLVLAGGEGTRVVEAQFRDSVGNLSAVATASILLDLTPPTGSLALNAGAAVVLPWETLDAEPAFDDGALGSGVVSEEFSDDGGASWTETVEAGATPLDRPPQVAEGPAEILVRFRDAAGNVSAPAAATAFLVAAPSQALESAKKLTGTLAAGGDIDAFTVELLDGDVLSIRTTAKSLRRSGSFGVELDVYDPAHAKVVDGRWPAGAKKPGVAKYTAHAPGTYVVLVRAVGDDAGAGGIYTLSQTVARPKSMTRVRGVAVPPAGGAGDVMVLRFQGTQGGFLSGTLKVPGDTLYDLAGPDGSVAAFVARGKRGTAKLAAIPLTGGTGAYELRVTSFAQVTCSLTLVPMKRVARANEVPPAGQR